MAARRNGAMLLDEVLTQRQVEPESIERLMRERTEEDQHLEYKRGEWLQNDGGHKLRKWVSAFANADGGVLLVGASNGEGDDDSHPKWTIDGATSPTKQPLHTWVAQALRSVAQNLRTPPRIEVVDCKGGPVLVVACKRADALVSIPHKSQLEYYLRVGDAVVTVPPYLHADLVLGRRSTPRLSLSVADVTALGKPQQRRQYSFDRQVRVRFDITVENNSIVWADGLYGGLLVPALDGPWRPPVDDLIESVTHNFASAEEGIQHVPIEFETQTTDLRPLTRSFATAKTHVR